MIMDGMSPEAAAAYAMETVGRDPDYESSLRCFPR
jgi:hypothetical protein